MTRASVGAGIILFIVACASSGCYAHRRPSPSSAEDRALLNEGPLPFSVTVALWDDQTKTGQNPEAYAGKLADVLMASKAFKTARYERSSAPTGQDLVATSTGLYCNSAVVPLFTIITLGIFPTVFEDEHCEGLLLRRAAGTPKSDGVQIQVRYKGTVVMGWGAIVMGLLPGWSYGGADRDSRFAEHFRLAVIRQREQIDRLMQQR